MSLPSRDYKREAVAPAPPLRGKRLLIIAEAGAPQQSLSLEARAWGMLPYVTASGEEAVELVRHGEPFDVALLVVQRRDPHGPWLVAALRSLRPAAALPLILALAPGVGADYYSAAADRAQALLAVPLRLGQLHAVLTSLLTAKGEGAPAFVAPLPLNILLVEADPTSQILTEDLLRLLGHRVTAVDSGPAALTALECARYDLVLLDLQLAEMDGLAVARAICGRWTREQRPTLVALTGHSSPVECERCLAAGMDDYLGKPLSLEALADALARQQAASAAPALAAEVGRPTPTLDLVALERLREKLDRYSPATFASIVQTFLEDAARVLPELREAAEQGHDTRLAQIAHKLKSSSAIVAAARLSRLCATLEDAGPAASPAERHARVEELAAELGRAQAALSAHCPPGEG